LFCTFYIEKVQFGNYLKNNLYQKISNSVLGESTADVTANSEICALVIVIDGKEIIIKTVAVAYSVMIFARRFMAIRRFVFKFIKGVLEPYTIRSLGIFL
jgi:hypothetical protein